MGGKSPETIAAENQIKALYAQYVAEKEAVAQTFVARFAAKPPAAEAQKLLRISKIFSPKSIALYAAELTKAKTVFEAAVSKVKAAENIANSPLTEQQQENGDAQSVNFSDTNATLIKFGGILTIQIPAYSGYEITEILILDAVTKLTVQKCINNGKILEIGRANV